MADEDILQIDTDVSFPDLELYNHIQGISYGSASESSKAL